MHIAYGTRRMLIFRNAEDVAAKAKRFQMKIDSSNQTF